MASVILGGKENFLLWREKESLADCANRVWLKVRVVKADFVGHGGNKPACRKEEAWQKSASRHKTRMCTSNGLCSLRIFLQMWVVLYALYGVLNVFIKLYMLMQMKNLPYQEFLVPWVVQCHLSRTNECWTLQQEDTDAKHIHLCNTALWGNLYQTTDSDW